MPKKGVSIMETKRTFRVFAKEVRKENRSFIVCNAQINGRWYKIKFTKTCNETPKIKGLYDVTVDFDNCSIEKGKPYTTADGRTGVANDTIWIKRVEILRMLDENEVNQINRDAMWEVFGEE